MNQWKDHLLSWESYAIAKYREQGRDYPGEDIKSDCMDRMQQHYPGGYDLVWAKDPEQRDYHLAPRFHSPADETAFILRWS
jgi:hypothetical protein